MMDDYAVYIKNANKSYGSNVILSNLCMKVPRGSIYGLLGASGCGKTTLLSCIVGRKKLQSGEIYVLGGKPGDPESGVPGNRVGYMPQDIALVAEFTVKGAVFYFGRIFNMKDDLIETRYQTLRTLLDLPPDDRLVKECSGGQQRRVSFAAAMVNKPELLILDEPTVGLDPVLRDRIWNYLVEITQKEKISVIITTHYIEEASQANKIGLLRGGRLLAEEHPEQLLRLFGADSLEEVFLNLSKQQEEGRLTDVEDNTVENQNNSVVAGSTNSIAMSVIGNGSQELLTESKKSNKKTSNNSSFINKNRFKALMGKNWNQYSRNLGGVAWTLIFPVLEALAFSLSIGTDIKGINLGVINDENVNNFCNNISNINTTMPYSFSSCNLTAMSCRFLKELNDPMLSIKYYDSVDKALAHIHTGKVVGVLYIANNFTESLQSRLHDGSDVSEEILDASQIKVWLDLSNRQIGYTIKYKLYDLYQEFQKKVFNDCHFSEKLSDYPVRIETPVFGKKDDSFAVFMVPGVLMSIMFFMGTTMTSTIIISDRMEGVWDRSIVGGVTTIEIMLTHLITQFILIVMQVIEVYIILFLLFKYEFIGSLVTMIFMTILQGLSGMCFGFWISVISDNHNFANMASTGTFYPMLVLCGLIWPLEAQPNVLRWISQAMPFTIPIISLRNVMHKGWSIVHPQVINGVCIEVGWIIFLAIISGLQMKRKR